MEREEILQYQYRYQITIKFSPIKFEHGVTHNLEFEKWAKKIYNNKSKQAS
jgi:hypothetical protein